MMACTTAGSFSPNACVAICAPMSRNRYGWPDGSRSTIARYGPMDSDGSKATGREKEAPGCRLESGVRRGEELSGELVERAIRVAQRLRDVHMHIAGPVAAVQIGGVLEECFGARCGVGRDVHGSDPRS